MSAQEHRRTGERGETLAELLVTISIMSIAIIVIVGALADGILASNVHRNHATADAAVRSVAECVKDRSQPYQQSGAYPACPAPSGTNVSIAAAWWNGDSPATFSSSPTSNGLEQLTISATNDRATEPVVILKRRT
jgi:Tfp pilus assembly protein FimT